MRNKKFIIFLTLAIIFSFLASNFIMEAIKSYAPVVKYDEPVKVVIATKDITPYTTIKSDQVGLKEIPASLVLPDHIKDLNELIGSVSRGLILSGDFIRKGHLTEIGSTDNQLVAELSAIGNPNLRAVLVPLPKGFEVKKGDRINIIYTEKNRDSVNTKTLFQNITVLKSENEQAFLAINQYDAELLANALSSGQVMYTLSPVIANRMRGD